MLNLDQLKKNQPAVLILRHAEKAPIDDIKLDATRGITTTGRQAAIALGHMLQQKIDDSFYIVTSPVQRCVDTSQAIRKACGEKNVSIENSTLLGAPGIFIKDDKLAFDVFKQYDVYKVVSQQLQGKKLPGFRSIKSACQVLIKNIKNDLTNRLGTTLYITHDVILAAFVGYITNTLINQYNWFNYLDGISIVNNDSHGLSMCWKNKNFTIKGV